MGTTTLAPHKVGFSPLLANMAPSVLDEHIAHAPGGPAATPYQWAKRRRDGLPNYRPVRCAADWVLAVSGTLAPAPRSGPTSQLTPGGCAVKR